MTLAFLGLDLAKDKFDAYLLQPDHAFHRTFANSAPGFEQLTTWLSKHGADAGHACMEATGTYGDELALLLHDAG